LFLEGVLEVGARASRPLERLTLLYNIADFWEEGREIQAETHAGGTPALRLPNTLSGFVGAAAIHLALRVMAAVGRFALSRNFRRSVGALLQHFAIALGRGLLFFDKLQRRFLRLGGVKFFAAWRVIFVDWIALIHRISPFGLRK